MIMKNVGKLISVAQLIVAALKSKPLDKHCGPGCLGLELPLYNVPELMQHLSRSTKILNIEH